jgi:hypothetical protein
VPLVGHQPGPVWVVFADRVAVLGHEHMFAQTSLLAVAATPRGPTN